MGEAFVVRTDSEWRKQVGDAWAALEARGFDNAKSLRDAYDLDRAAFSKLIEAMVALGENVDAEMQRLAGLRPVSEILGLP